MQALKSLVIFMAVLIAIGVTVVGVTIYRRAMVMVNDDKAPTVTAPVATAPIIAAPPHFGLRSLDLPPGSIIVSVQPFDSRVMAHVRLADGGTSILLLDPVTGDVAGEWRTTGGGPPGVQVPTRPQPALR